MAGRIRSIKPEVLEDEPAAGLSDAAWRLWVSSWLLADDHGRFRAGAKYLAAHVWLDTHKAAQAERALEELARERFVRRYQVEGQLYAEIKSEGWKRHQKIDHPGLPRVPVPKDSDYLDGNSRKASEPLVESRDPSALAYARGTSDLRPPTTTTTTSAPPEGRGPQAAPPPPDPDPWGILGDPKTADLSAREFAVLQALHDDESLAPICKDLEALAKDLVKAGPAVDCALEVRRAGAWMRSAGAKGRKKQGNRFLVGWIMRQQERGGTRGYMPPDDTPPRTPPAAPAPRPEVLAQHIDAGTDLGSLLLRIGAPPKTGEDRK